MTGVNEVSRRDFFAPSTRLFEDHCAAVVQRYGLAEKGLVRHAQALDVTFVSDCGGGGAPGVFTVASTAGTYRARIVVLAVGPGQSPVIPADEAECEERSCQTCHSMNIRQLPDPVVREKISIGQATSILIVGGGLTSIQIADLALRRGVSKVCMLMRGKVKVKPFDVDLGWMARDANVRLTEFWAAETDKGESITGWHSILYRIRLTWKTGTKLSGLHVAEAVSQHRTSSC